LVTQVNTAVNATVSLVAPTPQDFLQHICAPLLYTVEKHRQFLFMDYSGKKEKQSPIV
jgi:hypothetical protein